MGSAADTESMLSRVEICLLLFSAFSTVSVQGSRSFLLISGNCTVNDEGNCFYSPSYPDDYPNLEYCLISVIDDTALQVVIFATEPDFDYLIVDGRLFSGHGGTVGLDGTLVRNGSRILWIPDGSVTYSGFAICNAEVDRPSEGAEVDRPSEIPAVQIFTVISFALVAMLVVLGHCENRQGTKPVPLTIWFVVASCVAYFSTALMFDDDAINNAEWELVCADTVVTGRKCFLAVGQIVGSGFYIIAVGQVASGVFALGQVATGLFSCGMGALGILNQVGMMSFSCGRSRGMISFGGSAAGMVCFGFFGDSDSDSVILGTQVYDHGRTSRVLGHCVEGLWALATTPWRYICSICRSPSLHPLVGDRVIFVCNPSYQKADWAGCPGMGQPIFRLNYVTGQEETVAEIRGDFFKARPGLSNLWQDNKWAPISAVRVISPAGGLLEVPEPSVGFESGVSSTRIEDFDFEMQRCRSNPGSVVATELPPGPSPSIGICRTHAFVRPETQADSNSDLKVDAVVCIACGVQGSRSGGFMSKSQLAKKVDARRCVACVKQRRMGASVCCAEELVVRASPLVVADEEVTASCVDVLDAEIHVIRGSYVTPSWLRAAGE